METSTFYGLGGNQRSLENVYINRFNRLPFNTKVKAKLLKDSKSTSKKRPKSTSKKTKTVTNYFPGILLPHKKKLKDNKLTSKKNLRSTSEEKKTVTNLIPGTTLPFDKQKLTPEKSFVTTEISKEKNILLEENVVHENLRLNVAKPSLRKKDWTDYIKLKKPERVKIVQPSNRKFFKSKVKKIDVTNKKDNSFNFKIVNWDDKNIKMDNKKTEVKSEDVFKDTEILVDDVNKPIEQQVEKSIKMLHDKNDNDSHSTTIQYPGPISKPINGEIEDNDTELCMSLVSERMKTNVQNHHNVLFEDVYDFDDNCSQNQCYSANSPTASHSIDSFNTTESNNMITDESVNISNVHNESLQTKILPILTNQLLSSGYDIRSNKKHMERKVKRIMDATQYQIDAGQKKFGGFLCQQCDFYYSRGEPEDEREHEKYHLAKEIIKYYSFKDEKIVYEDVFERIILITSSDSKIICSKALEVISFVDKELGINIETSDLPSTKKVYLYIMDYQVVGCLVVEIISEAYRNLETETEDMVIISEESYPVKVGVNRLWTKRTCRGTGIATRLLDCFRKNYIYGHILRLDQIAFTVPTRAGKHFIKKYTKKNDYLVYTGW